MSPTGFRPGPGDTEQDQYTVTVQKVITRQRCPQQLDGPHKDV